MNANWNEDALKIKAFKNYMKKAPKSVPQKKGYLLKREDIEKLLNQKEGMLDGIRIYFGAEMVEDFMVPTLVVVGCEKDEDGTYNDFDVPEKNLKNLAVRSVVASARSTSSVELHPCPTICGKSNILNS